MKRLHCPVKFWLAAFAVLVSFTAASCPQVSLSETASLPPESSPEPKARYPVPVALEEGKSPITPARFYLDENYEPAEADTGKTAFAFKGKGELEAFLAAAEETGDDTVARFLDGSNGMAAAMYFTGEEPFPARFTVVSEEDSTAVHGVFSPYDDETETFALVLHCGEETSGPLTGFTLNKNAFDIYEDDLELSAGENARIRNYVTAMSVWTAMTSQFQTAMETGEYESALSGILSSGTGCFFAGGAVEAVGRGVKKAVDNICAIGVKIEAATYAAFKLTAALVVTSAAEIDTVAAPVAVAVGVAAAITVTPIDLADIGAEDDDEPDGDSGEEPPEPPPLPPEKRKAPRFAVYYRDEEGKKQTLPVMREGQAPETGDEFYIRPHDSIVRNATSNVKFYFETTSVEPPDGEIKTCRVFSPYSENRNEPYRLVSYEWKTESTVLM